MTKGMISLLSLLGTGRKSVDLGGLDACSSEVRLKPLTQGEIRSFKGIYQAEVDLGIAGKPRAFGMIECER